MPLDLTERRTLGGLTEVINDALDLAEKCGWRYALAFLVSEDIPSEIIQRLLSGGGRARPTAEGRFPNFPRYDSNWKGRDTDAMVRLFDSLRARGLSTSCTENHAPLPSRSSRHSDDND